MVSLRRSISANYLGQAWVAVMGLAFVPAYIRYLGIEAYGLIGLFAVLQAWLTVLDMGMTPTLMREMARFKGGVHGVQTIRNLLRSIEILCLGSALAIATVVWLAADYLAKDWLQAQALPAPTVTRALAIMGALVGLRLIEGMYRGSLFGLHLQVEYNIAAAVLATVRHGGAVAVLAWVSPTIEAFFFWQVFVSIASIAILAFGVHRVLPRSETRAHFSRTALSSVWKFAGGMLGITSLAVLLTQADKILLSRLLPLDAFGYYVLAATLAASLQLVVAPVTQSVYPRMVELCARKDDLALTTLYHKAARLVTVVTAPAWMLLTFFSENLVFVWTGDLTLAENVGPLLSILAIGSLLNSLMWLPYQCQLAHGWTSLALRSNAVAVVILVPVLAWLTPRYGATAAAWTWVALNAGYVLLNIQVMHKKLLKAEKMTWYFRDVALPLLGSILVGFAFAALRHRGGESREAWLLFILSAGISALIASALMVSPALTRMLSPSPSSNTV